MTVCWRAQVSEVVRGTERVEIELEMSVGVGIGLGASMLLIFEPTQNDLWLGRCSKGVIAILRKGSRDSLSWQPFRIRLSHADCAFPVCGYSPD